MYPFEKDSSWSRKTWKCSDIEISSAVNITPPLPPICDRIFLDIDPAEHRDGVEHRDSILYGAESIEDEDVKIFT